MKKICALSLSFVFTSLAWGKGATPPPVSGRVIEYDEYRKLIPNFAKACAVSKQSPITANAQLAGRDWGHGVIYLSKACLKREERYPVITTDCGPEERGVGISVDSFFRTSHFSAVPGHDLFFKGILKSAKEVLDAHYKVYNATVEAVKATGAFLGIRSDTSINYPNDEEAWTNVVQGAMGTDYALNYGRNVLCQSVPLTDSMLQNMVKYLNDLNEPYRTGKDLYKFDYIKDNCTHPVHNTLAAGGLYSSLKKTDAPTLEIAFNLAVPFNEVSNVMQATIDDPVPDIDLLYQSKHLSRMLMKEDYLPVQPGALFSFLKVHGQNEDGTNQFFSTKSGFQFLDVPFFEPVARRFRRGMEDPRYYDFEANLIYFRDRYTRALRQLPLDPDRHRIQHYSRNVVFAEYDFTELTQHYRGFLERKLQWIEEKLGQYRQMPKR